jgi:hypothetical protein
VFIAAGENGFGKSGNPTTVDNFFRPNVYDISDLLPSGGLLRLDAASGVNIVAGAVLVNYGNENTAWALPVITADNWFAAGSTAYLEGLARGGSGGTNLQIFNFGQKLANCQAQLLRPRGSAIADPVATTVKPLSSVLMSDVTFANHRNASANMRETVTCDQPFYAMATFAAPDVRGDVRVMYPLAGPPTHPKSQVNMDFSGSFFRPREGQGELTLDLPLKPNVAYRSVDLNFDFSTREDWDPVFTVILGMYHRGGPRFNTTLYFGTFIRGFRNRWVIDLGSPWLEVDDKRNVPFQLTSTYHVHILYDTVHAQMICEILDNHGNTVMYNQGGIFNYDLADRGNPVQLNFGVGGIADFAYFPPFGWRFSNLHVVATE